MSKKTKNKILAMNSLQVNKTNKIHNSIISKIMKIKMTMIMKKKIFTEAAILTPHSSNQLYYKEIIMIWENKIYWAIWKINKKIKMNKIMDRFMKCRWISVKLLKKERVFLICYIQERMMHKTSSFSRLTSSGIMWRNQIIRIMINNPMKTQVYKQKCRFHHPQNKKMMMQIYLKGMMIDPILIINM